MPFQERFYEDRTPFAPDNAGGTGVGLPSAGNLNVQIASAGVQPGATGVDSVLAVFTLPASFFDQANRGIQIVAAGSYAATVNAKRTKIIFNPTTAVVGSTVGGGGTTIADSGAASPNGGGWTLEANVFKYGAAGSNTQIGIHTVAQQAGAVPAIAPTTNIAAVENAPILIAVTGNATTVTTDITFNFLEIFGMN